MNPTERPRILYVEDDPASASLVQRVLQAEGYEVEVVDNGVDAIDTAQQLHPTLILMDINIGGLDGYEVTTRLRSIEDLEQVPIVAVTAATLQGDRERALIAGCDGYIAKPIDVDRFPEQVEEYLGGMQETIESPEEKAAHLEAYSRRLVKRLEEKIHDLQEAHAELQHVEKMKSDFIILASHELRTPLTSIYGYVQILLQNPDIPGDPDEEGSPRHMLNAIASASKRLHRVFDEIRNVSLIDAEQLTLACEAVNLEKVIHKVVRDVQNFGPDRDLTFTFEGLGEIPTIQGDSKRLHQAFWNVISNAMKYTPDGGEIHITGKQVDDTAHISVEDTGVGIPRDEQERIFDRFYVLEDTSLHRSSKTAFKGGGLGLGLTVTRGIIESHDGKIWVDSEGYDEEELPGSIFHILLPITIDNTDKCEEKENHAEAESTIRDALRD
jgi:signal transduction histidine kinase